MHFYHHSHHHYYSGNGPTSEDYAILISILVATILFYIFYLVCRYGMYLFDPKANPDKGFKHYVHGGDPEFSAHTLVKVAFWCMAGFCTFGLVIFGIGTFVTNYITGQ